MALRSEENTHDAGIASNTLWLVLMMDWIMLAIGLLSAELSQTDSASNNVSTFRDCCTSSIGTPADFFVSCGER